MSFAFDEPVTKGANRSAATTDCELCGGDRLIPVPGEQEAYSRCPSCNPDPTAHRPPVEADAWWKE
jgi:hypothetical protein